MIKVLVEGQKGPEKQFLKRVNSTTEKIVLK